MPPTPLIQRSHFPFWYPVGLRYSDMNTGQHIGAVRYPVYFEEARMGFMLGAVKTLMDPLDRFFMVHMSIDYQAELRYPGTLEIGTALDRLGNSTITLVQAGFTGNLCHASGKVILAYIDATTRRAVALPADVRAAFENYHA